MGQEISLRDFEIPDLFATNNQHPNDVLSTNEAEDVDLFLPHNIINEINENCISLPNPNSSKELLITKETLINQIRNDISIFSNLSGVNQFNMKMSEIIKEILDHIAKRNTNLQNSIQSIINKQKSLQNSYVEKLKDDENETTSIFSETFIESEKVSNEEHIKELSFFAVQSLINMLLMLLETVHKSDSTIVHRMLNLTNQLVQQIPLNSFSSDVYKRSHCLFKSLKPLTTYIEDLSIQTDINPTTANQSIQILFCFSVLKSSFKDILPFIRKLIFNTNDIFDMRTLVVKLNKHLTMMIDQSSQNTTENNVEIQNQNRTDKENEISLDMKEKFLNAVKYLESIEAYPNTKLIKSNENKFTGQFICSILLVHIDLHNQLFKRNSLNGSFSFELDTKTFKYLYEIIEQLTTSSDTNLSYILNVCLRLFTTHLQLLIDANLENFHEFLTENEIDKWFTLISKLAFQDKKEASQALIYLIDKQILSFGKMLTFIHQHIIENQHTILIDQLLNKLNQQIFIYKWIEILSKNQNTEDRALAYTVLHSFIDLVLKSIDNDNVNRLSQILITFQELFFVYLNNQSNDLSDGLQLFGSSTLTIEYTTHIIKYCLQQNIQSILFEPVLLGLSTLTDLKYNFSIIQPIFTGVMPLFAEYVLETNIDTERSKTYYLISWLIGKMSHRLIVGPSENELEKKYNKILKSPLFSGGYETLTKDINPYLANLFQSNLSIYTKFLLPFRRQESILDNDLLISIYRNIDQGEKLISKMKLFTREKYFVQKSIEDLTNETCAAVFAVYIKHYRRIDLAQYELIKPIEQKPHPKLLMLYEYANELRRIFATAKGRGDDCYELSQRIKTDALLLIVSIRESSFISKIKEGYLSPNTINKKLQFQRQKSHWTKAKLIVRLLRHTLNACIRFKYFILEKKRAIQNKQDNESIMHRAISKFLYGENQKFKIDPNEIVQCLTRQYQRAMTRFVTYSFIEKFLNSSKEINRYSNILFVNLNNNNNHYLENIQASNYQLKEDIGRIYYKIMKNILSFSTESSSVKIFQVFNFINLNYDSIDLSFLNEFQFVQDLFLNLNENLDLKLTSFNWFRLVTLKLCENIQLEFLRNLNIGNRKFHQILEQLIYFIFNKFILNQFKQNQLTCQHLSSFKNLSFVRSSTNDVNICLDQYLILFLRCIHFYEHIRLYCATIDFVEQLFNLYETNQSLITRLLSLKILRDLLIHVSDGIYRSYIKNILTKILFSIGQNFNLLEKEKIHLEIIIEFISIYRQILSKNSPWQKFATELIINGIQFGINSLETQQLNEFIGSLCILGGYVRPFCLGSTVEIYSTNTDLDELQFGIIIEIDKDARESDSSDVKPYLAQYATTNQIEWISSNQIRIIDDVQTPNLLVLPIDNTVHTILDTLGFIAEKLDTSTIDSLILLDIKYRVVKSFYELLNSKQIIDIFMDKPYASIIAKLSISIDQFHKKPNDLRLFNRLHFEQYYLSLERYATKNETIENKFPLINQMKIVRDPIILEYLSEINWINQHWEWKPIASKNEINTYKKGRLGNDDIRITCLPVNDNTALFQQCGIKHKFKGRVQINDDVGAIQYRTFIPDGIQFNQGKWYFCVRFPTGGVARVGWATTKFNPMAHDSYGLGDNKYSWSYNGDDPVHDEDDHSTYFSDGSWDKQAVCGCGIEINGRNTNIKYWLNGKFVDTIYSHMDNQTIKSKVKTNLLPNGALASYFPGVTVKLNRNTNNEGVFEFIFSPEDMTECPLPKGYKPLLMPKLLTMENVLVPYPYSAYLIGNDIQQYFERKRYSNNDSNMLRDFVNDQHFEVPFNADMIKTEDFSLSLDNHQELTISFHFEIIPTENLPNELDIVLFKFDDDARFSIHICIDESNLNRQHVTILFQINEQTKVYINNKLQILNYYHSFHPKINSKLNLQLLPNLNVRIRNLGIWKYLLSEENIQRLFTYGISYVSIDYQTLNAYQKRFNTIQFKAEQKYFNDETLVPLNQPFQQDLWEETKRSIKHDESNYFKTITNTNQSVLQFFGNKTYLVLDTADQVWEEYTFILDIFIPNFPSKNNKLTLLSLGDESEIYITEDGHLHVNEENESSSSIKCEEYIRLLISVQEYSIEIYIPDCLEFNVTINENQFATKLKHIHLFRELDLTKNTTNDNQLRIQCRSITYLNKDFSSIKNLVRSTDYPLDQLILPSFNILSTTLIGIGYKEESIEYVINKYKTTKIYFIDKILREENKNIYEQKQQQKRSDVLQRLSSYDENGTLNMLLDHDNITINTQIDEKDDEIPSDQKWFYDTVRSVGIHDKLDNWLQDNQLTTEDSGKELLDLTKTDSDERKLNKTMSISSHYTHRQIQSESYIDLRTTCEYGLITINAHHTILRMLKVWFNNDQLNLFPLMKFGNAHFIVKFFESMYDHHHHHTNIDRMDRLVKSMIRVQLEDLLKCIVNEKLTVELLNRKAPIFFQFQKEIVQLFLKQSNIDFLFKIFHLFFEVFKDFEGKTNDIDLLIRLIFPNIIIKILFDLFLLIPLHQSKIFIIDVFTKLIQTSEHFKLHKDIQNFVEHMFIEVSDNEPYSDCLALKLFRRFLVLFELTLMEREKQLITPMNEWPGFVKDLAIVLDVSSTFINKTKSCQLFELILTESEEITSETSTLTKEMVETAQTYFDTTADLQVMKFMNENIKLDGDLDLKRVITDFIKNLPAESIPDTTKYASFTCLCNIPSIYVRTRIELIYLFNIFLQGTLSTIDFSVPSGLGFIVDRIRSVRHYILFLTKFEAFNEVLTQTAVKSSSSEINVEFDILKGSLAEHPEDTMFYQAYKQLKSDASSLFRLGKDEKVWNAIYVGMHSNDQGGPYRDSVTRICADLCSTRLSLFVICPNGRTDTGLNRDRWTPNVFPPNRSIPIDIKNQYRFVGQLMGMAIRTKQYVDLRFPILLWKQLIYEEVTIEDIESIDSSCFRIINKMQENIQKVKSLHTDNDDDYLIDSIMDELTFDVVTSTGQTYELVPGGSQIQLTTDNFQDYCNRYRQYRINEFSRQIEYIRQGLYSVVPWGDLTVFTAQELEELVCGKGYIDIQMLKRHTRYENDNESSPHIQLFWSVLSDMFTEEQKKLFLIFVWGRSTLPYTDQDFSQKFTIRPRRTTGNIDQALPTSSTCAFTLHLPAYSTKEIMYERLNCAITYCHGIDADGHQFKQEFDEPTYYQRLLTKLAQHYSSYLFP